MFVELWLLLLMVLLRDYRTVPAPSAPSRRIASTKEEEQKKPVLQRVEAEIGDEQERSSIKQAFDQNCTCLRLLPPFSFSSNISGNDAKELTTTDSTNTEITYYYNKIYN
uniref:Uncharacterized protein n=1 Tax=Arundo donax TaxID=35708 RepID=A0A0A8XWZ9_ARUDO